MVALLLIFADSYINLNALKILTKSYLKIRNYLCISMYGKYTHFCI